MAVSKFSIGAALIGDFVAGFYNIREFSFFAGCSNTVGLVLMSYAQYAFSESKNRNNDLAKLFKRLNFDVPAIRIERGSIGDARSEEQQIRQHLRPVPLPVRLPPPPSPVSPSGSASPPSSPEPESPPPQRLNWFGR